MKEFEKWWKKINEHPHCSLPQHKWQAEVIWRAALEWVKSRSEVAKSLYMISVNDIDEELEK